MVRLRIVTNDHAAGAYFRDLLAQHRVPGLVGRDRTPLMFFVLHVRDRTFRPLSASALITNLQRDWPGVEISRHPRDAVRDVAWTYRDDDGIIEGSQDREGNGHYLSGPNRLVARHAVWWRRQVPSSHPMLLYDEAYSISVDIERDTTIEMIEAAIGD